LQSKFIMIGDIRTHYIEAGEGDRNLILLHGAEYGGNSRNSWEYNIDALAKHFHVYAIDMIGFGETDKLFKFAADMRVFRIEHIRKFMKILCIESASFTGNSMGGGLSLKVASQENPAWNIDKIITISGGGPNNTEIHNILGGFDGTMEYMHKIHELMFYNDQWKTDEYVQKRYESSIAPGAWEALSVSRFRSPLAPASKGEAPVYSPAYKNIKCPVLVVAGDEDPLKLPDFTEQLASLIPNVEVQIFDQCRHCAQIEYADKFNRMAVDFLLK
jgi:2-hydroxymuconate-semialdehyde hydrolase